jgi:hypothetical protein
MERAEGWKGRKILKAVIRNLRTSDYCRKPRSRIFCPIRSMILASSFAKARCQPLHLGKKQLSAIYWLAAKELQYAPELIESDHASTNSA